MTTTNKKPMIGDSEIPAVTAAFDALTAAVTAAAAAIESTIKSGCSIEQAHRLLAVYRDLNIVSNQVREAADTLYSDRITVHIHSDVDMLDEEIPF